MPDIFDELDHLQDEMRQMIRQVYFMSHSGGFLPERSWHPPMDVFRKGESLIAVLEVPGASKINLVFHRGVLVVSGFRGERPETRGEGRRGERVYHQMEVRYGRFERQIRLPAAVDAERISAHMEEGFLRITIPLGKRTERETFVIPIEAG